MFSSVKHKITANKAILNKKSGWLMRCCWFISVASNSVDYQGSFSR